MELASIIVPVYNIEKYVGACIESLQAQTYQNIEMVLVDDGGTDQSGAICDEYAKLDARIRVIHKPNGGLSDARNTGAREASGNYLFFVDGDDTVSPRLVEKAVQCAVKIDADMVFYDFESIEEETGRRDLYHYDLPVGVCFRTETYPEILIKSPSACCSLYKKEFWDKSEIRYPQGIHYEDLATTPRFLLKAERIGYVADEPLYYYMLRQGSIMRSNNFERSYKDRTYVLDFLKKTFHEQNADVKFKRELEYLFFEHGYFIPSKEVVLADSKSPWLLKFRTYGFTEYPDMLKSPYISKLSGKDRILLSLMNKKMYGIMNLLSGMRKKKDSIIK